MKYDDEYEKALLEVKQAWQEQTMPHWMKMLFWAWFGFMVGSVIIKAVLPS